MLDKLIKYFAYATKGHITKIQLIRFLYLADLYAVKWTGKQLTQLNWYYYHLGPWHEDINTALDKMNGQEINLETEYNTTFIKLGIKAGNIDDLQLPINNNLSNRSYPEIQILMIKNGLNVNSVFLGNSLASSAQDINVIKVMIDHGLKCDFLNVY